MPSSGLVAKNSKNFSLPRHATEKTLSRGDNRKHHDLYRIAPFQSMNPFKGPELVYIQEPDTKHIFPVPKSSRGSVPFLLVKTNN
jgi:hypothetical protein